MEKMTSEEKEALRSFASTPYYGAILGLMERIIYTMERNTLDMDLKTESFANLAISKAKVDGARVIKNKLKSEIGNLKKE
jgi:hypothetical protein